VVINATSASLSGQSLPLPAGLFASGALAYDMMYGKGETPFLQLAASRERGVAPMASACWSNRQRRPSSCGVACALLPAECWPICGPNWRHENPEPLAEMVVAGHRRAVLSVAGMAAGLGAAVELGKSR